MRYFTIIFIFCFGIFSCQNVKAPEKPENLIAKDKMVEVLTEAYLANAARSVDNKSIISKGIKIDTILYKKFGIDSLQFAKSNAYYAADANLYIDIFTKVESKLAAMQNKMDSLRQVNKTQKDSITNTLLDKQNDEPVRDSLI